MARRKRSGVRRPARKQDWRTTVWYVIGALIVLAMVFALVASAFVPGAGF
ncbi:MAG: hypothetical protein HUU23_14030 [Caldilineales bacterium]|nr:hypothetical protein [Caldilineales bacterium]